MDTLYCFRLDEDTGVITRYEITEYHEVKYGYRNGKSYLKFNANIGGGKAVYTVNARNIDSVFQLKVYSFEDSLEKAVSKFKDYYKHKKYLAEKEIEKMSNRLEKIESVYGE